jgi:hypothetical protein
MGLAMEFGWLCAGATGQYGAGPKGGERGLSATAASESARRAWATTFFVTGFPRSRTGWLANLLTVPPGSLCVHDVVAECEGVEELSSKLQAPPIGSGSSTSSKFRFVGVSDPALALVWREVVASATANWPGAKWVHIYRDIFDASRAYAAFLEDHGWGMPWDQVRAIMLRWERELAELESVTAVKRLEYARLDEAGYVREVWDWIFAGSIPWDEARFEMLRRLNVQTIPSKAPASKGWIERAMGQRKETAVWAMEQRSPG